MNTASLLLMAGSAAVLLLQARPKPAANLTVSECGPPAWNMVFRNDTLGRDVGGKRADLLNALRRGSPIRVAWGVRTDEGTSVVEFAEPIFTSLMGERDVVIQFPMALIQTDYVDATKALLRSPPLEWRALMSTDGRFDAIMTDRETGKIFRRLQQRAIMTWYALAPPAVCDSRPIPALAVPRGVFLDSAATGRLKSD
jgi:hypothetical protein